MRNLKRVLSLSLASVMLLGMMVIGAGAKDYTDNDSISQKEAAQVMEAIGVMQGNDKGEFLPTADLTREAAAKIITYLLLGKTTADGLTTGKAPFDDVEAGRWSAGSIAYCSSQGIISGDGKGNFFPTQTVTGTQFAKMLLGALGYKADAEGYVGPDYVQNIAKAVVATKLNKGVSGNLSETLTREEAARMALNTLTARLVQYSGGVKVPNGNGQYIEINATRSYVEAEGSAPGSIVYQDFKGVYQPNLKLTEDIAGTYGRPSHKWSLGKTEIGTYPDAADLTYTAKVSKSDMSSALSGYNFGATTPVVINGVNDTLTTPNTDAFAALTGAGRQVEFYVNSKTFAIRGVVVIDTVLAQIGGINTTTKEARITPVSFTGTLPGGLVNNTIQVVTEKDNKDMYAKLAGMKADDYVLVTFDKAKVASVAVPETITGTYTGYNSSNSKRTIGGTTYDDSYATKNFATNTSHLSDKLTATSLGTDFLVYMDPYGNPIYASDAVVASSKYAYVLDSEKTGDLSANGRVYNAKLLFDDGTQQWVKIANIDKKSASSNGDFESAKFDHIENQFVKYAVRADGSYDLTNLASGGSVNTSVSASGTANEADRVYSFTNVNVAKNEVYFLGQGKGAMGTSKTTFLVATSDGSYKAYTGIKNISSWNGVDVKMVVAGKTASANMAIVSKAGGVTSVEKGLVYLLSGSYNAKMVGNDTIYTYNAVVNGKVTTIDLKTTTNAAGGNLGRGLYTLDSYSGDYADTLSVASGYSDAAHDRYVTGTMAANGIAYNNGTVTLTNAVGTSPIGFVTSSDFVMVAVRADNNAASEISPSQLQYYDASKVTDFVITLDDSGVATSVIFVYTL